MAQNQSQALEDSVERHASALRAISDEGASAKRGESSWSRKEELGHLIDSAANNHIRLARASLDSEFRGPGYEQERWVDLHGYSGLPWQFLIDFWRQYNLLLARVIARIPEDRFEAPCAIGSNEPVTVRALITDYIRHMQHHLDHILSFG